MGIKSKILTVLAVIGSFFSAVFFVLFRQAKEENKLQELEKKSIEETLKETTAAVKSEQAAAEAGKKFDEEHEQKIQEAHSGNNLDAFNACNELLSK